MVANGITRARLPAGNEIVCTLDSPGIADRAARLDTTRSAAALDLWLDRLGGSLVAIGNAPTALFRLLELIDQGAPKPAAIIGMPVGFVGAAESKEALARPRRRTLPHRQGPQGRQRHGGRRRQRAGQRGRVMSTRGTLYGVGVGPGDPELMSLKAARILKSAPVIAYFAKKGSVGNARRIVDGQLNPDAELVRLDYPFTTELAETDPCYRDALVAFYDASAATLAAKLDAGQDVAVICAGDPFFYGSYAHLHERLAGTHRCEVIPGITAMSGCWTRASMPMTCGDEMLAVLSGTMDADGSRRAARGDCEAAVIMKVGRNLAKIRQALARAGKLDRAVYVERGTMPEERIVKLADKPDDQAAYFAVVLVPGERKPL